MLLHFLLGYAVLAVIPSAPAQPFPNVTVQGGEPLKIVLTWGPNPDPFVPRDQLSLELRVKEPDGSFLGRDPCQSPQPTPTSPTGGAFTSPATDGYSRSPEEYTNPTAPAGTYVVGVDFCGSYYNSDLPNLPDFSGTLTIYSAGLLVATFPNVDVVRPYFPVPNYTFYVTASLPAPALTVRPTNVDFGCSASLPATKRLFIMNTGQPGSVLSGTVTPVAPPFFVGPGLGDFVLQGGASRAVDVSLVAPAQQPGTMTIIAPGVSSVEVQLKSTANYDRRTDAPDGSRIFPREQPTDCLCWATSALTMLRWRGLPPVQTELQVAELADAAGPRQGRSFVQAYNLSAGPSCNSYNSSPGLNGSEWTDFVGRLGMRSSISGNQSSNLTPCQVKSMLASRGPALVVIGLVPELHAVTVIGVHDDGANGNPQIVFIDSLNLNNALVRELPFDVFMTAIQSAVQLQWVQY